MALEVSNLEYRAGGFVVVFNDNTIAIAEYKVVGGALVLSGLTAPQMVALRNFNVQNINFDILIVDARYGSLGGSGEFLKEVVEDPSPQLGGFLDLNRFTIHDDNGDDRGQSAFDFQLVRTDPSQVASGAFSFAGGIGNTASGLGSSAFGGYNIASGDYSFVIGTYSEAALYAQFAQAAGAFGIVGDAQFTRALARTITTDAEYHEIFLDGEEQQYTIRENTSYALTITIGARLRTAGGTGGTEGTDYTDITNPDVNGAMFKRMVLVNDDNGMIEIYGIETIGTDINPDNNYDVRITASNDPDNERLVVRVKHDDGVFSKTVLWVSAIEAIEIADIVETVPPTPDPGTSAITDITDITGGRPAFENVLKLDFLKTEVFPGYPNGYVPWDTILPGFEPFGNEASIWNYSDETGVGWFEMPGDYPVFGFGSNLAAKSKIFCNSLTAGLHGAFDDPPYGINSVEENGKWLDVVRLRVNVPMPGTYNLRFYYEWNGLRDDAAYPDAQYCQVSISDSGGCYTEIDMLTDLRQPLYPTSRPSGFPGGPAVVEWDIEVTGTYFVLETRSSVGIVWNARFGWSGLVITSPNGVGTEPPRYCQDQGKIKLTIAGYIGACAYHNGIRKCSDRYLSEAYARNAISDFFRPGGVAVGNPLAVYVNRNATYEYWVIPWNHTLSQPFDCMPTRFLVMCLKDYDSTTGDATIIFQHQTASGVNDPTKWGVDCLGSDYGDLSNHLELDICTPPVIDKDNGTLDISNECIAANQEGASILVEYYE